MANAHRKYETPAADKLEAIGIEEVCEKIAECVSLAAIAKNAGVSIGSLITWLTRYTEQYARAKEAQAERFADEIL